MNKIEVITAEKATKKVKELQKTCSDRMLAKALDMSRVTMYKRLKDNKWRLADRVLIQLL